MKSFLSHVAADMLAKYGTDMSDIAVVFPNKRASLFLNENLAEQAGHPIWTPTYITISDLFRQHSELKVADPIKSICDLHKTFVQCTGIDETLDHFYGWGQLLLSDFDDVDKNFVDAKQLFSNLSDIHELDDISYLTDDQKKMIQKFFSNFTEDHNSELKKRFLQLWSHFYDIYVQFNKRLADQGLAYEGALYRGVVNNENIEYKYRKYLFVGFNMMQKVELTLCDRLMKEGKATFYWDYDRYYMDGHNEAGHYIRQYLKYYPNELGDQKPDASVGPSQAEIYDNLSKPKDITYISAPTENIQARYVSSWLKEKQRYTQGHKVAIVLSDENLLQSVIHSLPREVKSVNITVGYPLLQTPFYSLIQTLVRLQGLGHPKQSDTYRLHYVLLALRHPYARYISSRYAELLQKLDEKKQFYPSRPYLCLDGDEGLTLLFRDLDEAVQASTTVNASTKATAIASADDTACASKTATANSSASDTINCSGTAASSYNYQLIHYLLDVLKTIGTNAKQLEAPLFQESLYRTYTLLNRLQELIASGDLDIDVTTLERLIQQLIQTTSIPFHGEPAEGIQVMGVLETRNLDFEHVLVLSCNEGKLPKGVNDSSFIPYSLRKAYGLTTVENKVAIFAYYFHSLLQRASDITLTYNNATDEGQTGEMSRFMLQLMVESPHHILRKTLIAGQKPLHPEYEEAEKDSEAMRTLNEVKMITPTFLNLYQRCQKRFYYKYVRGLEEPDEIDEDEVDNRVFGNIFHRAAELFYFSFASPSNIKTNKDGKQSLIRPIVITPVDLDHALKDKSMVYRLVDQAFREELFKVSEKDYQPKYNGLQLINKEVIASYLRQLITIDRRQAPFTIIGLELVVSAPFDIEVAGGKRTFRLGGFIDRLDAVAANGNSAGKDSYAKSGDSHAMDDNGNVIGGDRHAMRSNDNQASYSNIPKRIRVIDYKTGRTQPTHPKEVDEVFSCKPQALAKHTDYYLQAMLYSIIVSHDKGLNQAQDPVSPALLFIQNAGADDYDPILKFGKELISDVAPYEQDYLANLQALIADIYNPQLPFKPTVDRRRCTYCPYAQLCK